MTVLYEHISGLEESVRISWQQVGSRVAAWSKEAAWARNVAV